MPGQTLSHGLTKISVESSHFLHLHYSPLFGAIVGLAHTEILRWKVGVMIYVRVKLLMLLSFIHSFR